MVQISVNKEKAIVFISAIVGIVSGYVASFNPTAAGIIGAASLATLTFWSEGVNTKTA